MGKESKRINTFEFDGITYDIPLLDEGVYPTEEQVSDDLTYYSIEGYSMLCCYSNCDTVRCDSCLYSNYINLVNYDI